MRPLSRLIVVVTFGVLGVVPTGSIVEATVPSDRVVAATGVALHAPSATPDGSADSGDDGPGLAPVLGGLVILGAVLAIGLSAIRRQRAEGRRSKLPPIG